MNRGQTSKPKLHILDNEASHAFKAYDKNYGPQVSIDKVIAQQNCVFELTIAV